MLRKKPITSWEQVPLILDLAQISMLLGIDNETARRKCVSGEIPAKKVGKFWRAEKNEIRRYLGLCE